MPWMGSSIPWVGLSIPWVGPSIPWMGPSIPQADPSIPWADPTIPCMGSSVPWMGPSIPMLGASWSLSLRTPCMSLVLRPALLAGWWHPAPPHPARWTGGSGAGPRGCAPGCCSATTLAEVKDAVGHKKPGSGDDIGVTATKPGKASGTSASVLRSRGKRAEQLPIAGGTRGARPPPRLPILLSFKSSSWRRRLQRRESRLKNHLEGKKPKTPEFGAGQELGNREWE